MPVVIRKISLFCSLRLFSPTSLQRAKNVYFSLIFPGKSAFWNGFKLRRFDVKKDFFFDLFLRFAAESSSDNFRFLLANSVSGGVGDKTRNQFDSNATWVQISSSATKEKHLRTWVFRCFLFAILHFLPHRALVRALAFQIFYQAFFYAAAVLARCKACAPVCVMLYNPIMEPAQRRRACGLRRRSWSCTRWCQPPARPPRADHALGQCLLQAGLGFRPRPACPRWRWTSGHPQWCGWFSGRMAAMSQGWPRAKYPGWQKETGTGKETPFRKAGITSGLSLPDSNESDMPFHLKLTNKQTKDVLLKPCLWGSFLLFVPEERALVSSRRNLRSASLTEWHKFLFWIVF